MNDYEPKNIHRSLNESVRQVLIVENMEKMAMEKMKDMDKDDIAYAEKLIKGVLERGAEEEMPSLTQAPDSAMFGSGRKRSTPSAPAGEPDATPSMPEPSFGQAVMDGVVNFLDVPESQRRPEIEIILAGLLDATGPGQLVNGAQRIGRLLRRLKKK